MPCFRWFSTHRDDGAVYRLLWAFPKSEYADWNIGIWGCFVNERGCRISIHAGDENFHYGRPKRATREATNPTVTLKRNFVV